MDTSSDITPEGSVAPVYLVPLTEEDQAARVELEAAPPDVRLAEQDALRQTAIVKLQSLGLTEDEARAIAGI